MGPVLRGTGRCAAGASVSRSVLAVVWLSALLFLACTNKANNPPTTTAPVGATVASGSMVQPPGATVFTPVGTPQAGGAPAKVTISSSRIETVKTVYDLLLDRYYKQLKPTDLLQSAWKGASQVGGRTAVQVDPPKLTGDRNADWEAFRSQYEQLFGKASGSVQGSALAFGAVDAMAIALHDDHTYFLNPNENKRRQATDSGGERFVGVGISVSNRAPYVVQGTVPGGPADMGGILAGDTVVAIDGVDAAKLSLDDLSKRLRGETAGSVVALSVRRADGSTQNVSLTRAEIVQPAIETKLLPGGVGYIALHTFSDAHARFADGRNIAETLDVALQTFEQAGVKGWIFDVRGNPGGSEQTLAEVAGRFLPEGLVLVSIDRARKTTEAPVDGHLFAAQRPLAVLVDGQSGSASELFAATMKEYGRARLFGQRTAGAVNGALETELPDGAAIQYTVVEVRTGKERRLLDGSGVSPDETVAGGGSASAILSGRTDQQFDRAKEWMLDQARKPAAPSVLAPPSGGTLSASEIRAKLQPFAATRDDIPAGPARGKFGDLVLNHPNELAIGIAADVPNAAAFTQKVRDRRWQGGYQEFFGSGEPAPYIVAIDLYRDENGARDAVKSNDYANDLTSVAPPARLGDDTTAYQGRGAADGTAQIVWRRGRLVFTAQFTAEPGQKGLEAALAVARRIDARAAGQAAP